MISNARCIAPSMLNAMRNANHATQRYATNATTLRQPQRNLMFLSMRDTLWISEMSPVKPAFRGRIEAAPNREVEFSPGPNRTQEGVQLMPNDTQAQGFGMIPNWLVRESDLSAYALLVYIALSGRANKNGECWPSLRLIAREARCSQSTARRAIKDLQRLGIIQVTGRVRKSDGGQTSNVYRVLVGQTRPPVSDSHGPKFTETPQEQDTGELDVIKELKSTLTSGRVSSHSSTVTASEAQITFLADCYILLNQELPDRYDYGQWEVMSSAQAHEDIHEYWSEIEHGGDLNLHDALNDFEDNLSPRALAFISKRLGLVAS